MRYVSENIFCFRGKPPLELNSTMWIKKDKKLIIKKKSFYASGTLNLL